MAWHVMPWHATPWHVDTPYEPVPTDQVEWNEVVKNKINSQYTAEQIQGRVLKPKFEAAKLEHGRAYKRWIEIHAELNELAEKRTYSYEPSQPQPKPRARGRVDVGTGPTGRRAWKGRRTLVGKEHIRHPGAQLLEKETMDALLNEMTIRGRKQGSKFAKQFKTRHPHEALFGSADPKDKRRRKGPLIKEYERWLKEDPKTQIQDGPPLSWEEFKERKSVYTHPEDYSPFPQRDKFRTFLAEKKVEGKISLLQEMLDSETGFGGVGQLGTSGRNVKAMRTYLREFAGEKYADIKDLGAEALYNMLKPTLSKYITILGPDPQRAINKFLKPVGRRAKHAVVKEEEEEDVPMPRLEAHVDDRIGLVAGDGTVVTPLVTEKKWAEASTTPYQTRAKAEVDASVDGNKTVKSRFGVRTFYTLSDKMLDKIKAAGEDWKQYDDELDGYKGVARDKLLLKVWHMPPSADRTRWLSYWALNENYKTRKGIADPEKTVRIIKAYTTRHRGGARAPRAALRGPDPTNPKQVSLRRPSYMPSYGSPPVLEAGPRSPSPPTIPHSRLGGPVRAHGTRARAPRPPADEPFFEANWIPADDDEKASELDPTEPEPEEDIDVRTRQRDLRVERAPTGIGIHTSYTHLIEGDLAPIGRVHLVSLGPMVGDEESRHFLSEMDADSNMGAQALLQSSRRGPFKASSGRSRVLDRSAHVILRKRGPVLEVTILRGVTDYEMDGLMGKLGAHRMSTTDSYVFFLDGRSKKLGNLDRIDFEKLRRKIEKALVTRRQIGLKVVDAKARGLLHRAAGHERGMKAAMRSKKQLANALI